jgi:hypothetical protein
MEEMTMRKYVGAFLVGIIALAPAIAAAQSGSGGSPGGSGAGSPGASGSGSGTSGSGASGSGNTAPGGSGSPSDAPSTSPSTAPSASPSGTSGDFAQYTSQVDCEQAGGMWHAASSKCEKK